MTLTQLSDLVVTVAADGEKIVEIPAYCHCDLHGDFAWECYYEDWEMADMLVEAGQIDCPLCLAEMVGLE